MSKAFFNRDLLGEQYSWEVEEGEKCVAITRHTLYTAFLRSSDTQTLIHFSWRAPPKVGRFYVPFKGDEIRLISDERSGRGGW